MGCLPAALLDGEDGSPTASASDVDTAANAVITVLHDEGGGSGRLGGALPMGGGDVFLDVNCCEAVKLEPSADDLCCERAWHLRGLLLKYCQQPRLRPKDVPRA